MPRTSLDTDKLYPSSDGKPMAESDLHRSLMVDLIMRLQAFFEKSEDVYVSGNLLVYYEEGNPKKSLSPDAFVAFGVHKMLRKTYLTWEEGVFPTTVFEITSDTTASEDMKKKFQIYQDVWQVKEYFLFDPKEEYLNPSLRGYRLKKGKFVSMKADKSGRITSKSLGITLERDMMRLVLRDAHTERLIPTLPEQEAGRVARAARRAQREAEIRLANVERENERLKQELDALKRSKPTSN